MNRLLAWTLLLALLLAPPLPVAAQDAMRAKSRLPLSAQTELPPLQIYVVVNGQQVGPMDQAEFARLLGTPAAAAGTLVWMPGMANWAPASTVAALQAVISTIGQPESGTFTPPVDPTSYMLGVWISTDFVWTISEKKFSAIVQMKLLGDGRFEGATLLRPKDDMAGPITISHEKGTWTVSDAGDGKFKLLRNIRFTDVQDTKVVGQGQLEDTFVFKATGPNDVVADDNIGFVRVPDQP